MLISLVLWLQSPGPTATDGRKCEGNGEAKCQQREHWTSNQQQQQKKTKLIPDGGRERSSVQQQRYSWLSNPYLHALEGRFQDYFEIRRVCLPFCSTPGADGVALTEGFSFLSIFALNVICSVFFIYYYFSHVVAPISSCSLRTLIHNWKTLLLTLCYLFILSVSYWDG